MAYGIFKMDNPTKHKIPIIMESTIFPLKNPIKVWLVKRISLMKVLDAHLKREERHKGKSEYRFHGDLSIDYGAKRVQIGENDLELTKLEYAIIEFLSMNPGQVFDRERIYEKVCGYDAEGDSRVVTELIRRVRKKLAEYTQTEYIETVWGMGYRWKR